MQKEPVLAKTAAIAAVVAVHDSCCTAADVQRCPLWRTPWAHIIITGMTTGTGIITAITTATPATVAPLPSGSRSTPPS